MKHYGAAIYFAKKGMSILAVSIEADTMQEAYAKVSHAIRLSHRNGEKLVEAHFFRNYWPHWDIDPFLNLTSYRNAQTGERLYTANGRLLDHAPVRTA